MQRQLDAASMPLASIDRLFDTFSRALNVLSAVWLAALALLILFDVVGREAFSAPIYGTNEIVSNSVLSIMLLQLPLSILTRRSLRTTLIYGTLGIRRKAMVDMLSYFLGMCLFVAIAIGGWNFMIESWAIGEVEGSGVISIPVYPIRTLVVGIGVFGALVCLLQVVKAVVVPETVVEE